MSVVGAPRVTSRVSQEQGISGRAAYAIFLMLLLPVRVQVVGQLFLTEVLLLATLPWLLYGRLGELDSRVRRLIALLGLWLIAAVASDVVLQTELSDLARGWARIAFTGTTLVSLALLVRSCREAALLLAAYGAGSVLSYVAAPNEYAAADPWKFGYGLGLTVVAVALCALRPGRSAGTVVLGGLGGLHLLQGYRSMAMICVIAAGLLVVAASSHRPQGLGRLAGRPVAALALLVVVVIGMSQLYATAASSGRLGQDQQAKYQQQARGSVGVALAARPEAVFATYAILDRPWLGHGSWAKRTRQVDSQAQAFLARQGTVYVRSGAGVDQLDLMPAHSHVLNAWVENGVLALPFWLAVMALAGRSLLKVLAGKVAGAPLVTFLSVNLLWDVLFSPYGAERKILLPATLVALIALSGRAR